MAQPSSATVLSGASSRSPRPGFSTGRGCASAMTCEPRVAVAGRGLISLRCGASGISPVDIEPLTLVLELEAGLPGPDGCIR